MAENSWLVMAFSLPKEPSKVRVSVWRKLKKVGAVTFRQSIWVLPDTEAHLAAFQNIGEEIRQNQGSCSIMRASFITDAESDEMIQRFNDARDLEYDEVVEQCEAFFREIAFETERKNFSFAELEENEEEYNKLLEWNEKVVQRDFFSAPGKARAAEYLAQCADLLEKFSDQIFEFDQD